jgi:hypothetical protein
MLIFKVTRPWAAAGIFLSSYVIGLTTWLLSSAVTLGVYGLFVLVIGWLFLGVGVVPVAIFAAFFGISNPALGWSIIVMCVVVFGFRMLGAALMDR